VEDVALSGEPKSSNIRMGVRYPNRIFLVNPGPGVAGALTSDNAAISIEYTIDGFEEPITESYNSNRIIYEVQGTIDSPKLVYEHGLIIRDYGGVSATTDEQSLIIGDEIYLPVLTGNLTASSSMETESLALRAMSQSYSRTKIEEVTITIDTDYPEVWSDLLGEEFLVGGKIVITSEAIRQITFPTGDVTADAMYAGMIKLSTRAVPVTYSSIDTSQDYPCILDIDIESTIPHEKKTHSTITATVKNVTAPYDIHADLTVLMNNPAMYDVFPDGSPTPWVVSDENEVSWEDITHPAYEGGVDIIVSFWIINTENNMQFFTSRVFSRAQNNDNQENWYQDE